MFGVHHAPCPIAFGLLDSRNGFRYLLELLYKERTMRIVFGQVFQHFCQTCQYPSVAPCPEVFLSVQAFVLRIHIFRVTIIQVLVFIEHDAIRVKQVLIQFFQIERVMGNLVKLGHDRHHHIQTVAPPPIIVIGRAHLVFHHLACPADFLVIRVEHIQVGIRLETNLIIAEQYILIALTIRIFPFRAVIALRTFPFVMRSPCLGIRTVRFISGQEISLHVSGMISGIVPEGTHFGRINRLPVLIDLINDFPHLLCLGRLGKRTCKR